MTYLYVAVSDGWHPHTVWQTGRVEGQEEKAFSFFVKGIWLLALVMSIYRVSQGEGIPIFIVVCIVAVVYFFRK